jgi:DNA-directed RNA polymerase specialized sigma24 family protein
MLGVDIAREHDDGERIGRYLLEFLGSRGADDGAPARAFQLFFADVSRWGPAFLQRRFASCRARCGDTLDIFDDAVQHLVIAVIEGRAAGIAVGEEARALAWCKRVLVNFVLDELRRQSRQVRTDTVGRPCDDSIEDPVQVRQALAVLVTELRREAARSAAPGKAKFRVALVDDFIANLLGVRTDARCARRDGRDQRRSRGRRVAMAAWQRLNRTRNGSFDFAAIAIGLGLDRGACFDHRRTRYPLRGASSTADING